MVEDLVKSYVAQARTYLDTAKQLRERYEFPEAVRAAQTCVELCLKAILKSAGIDPPHKHDVGRELLAVQEKLPATFREKVPKLNFISLSMALWRDPAMYGMEGQLPPDKLFGKEEADLALRYAEDVYLWCSPVSYGELY
jgi:HEPN domain-containing protein